ncbi:hypothetical protein GCM10022233_88090 [Streptomyces shaanxiensis]|uniref:Uncharacterized protein n=1 Tax=Streptomyces shaanxiensis TaxID=653357 RepID=A0ABP6UMI1_9ACTN
MTPRIFHFGMRMKIPSIGRWVGWLVVVRRHLGAAPDERRVLGALLRRRDALPLRGRGGPGSGSALP